MRLICAAAFAVVATPLWLANAQEDSELIGLITITRHGSRAPNPVTKQLCPNNMHNLNAYKVPLEELTHRGMEQLEEVGRFIREEYVLQENFLNSSWNNRGEVYFRADAANRCFQSAIAMGHGLYPQGSGGIESVPVFMQLPQNEHDFSAFGPCWTIHQEHLHQYGITRGKALMDEQSTMLTQVEQICGAQFTSGTLGDDPVMAIKDVADMFRFDRDEGLPMIPGLTLELADAMTRLSFQQMIERLYGTPREITYAIGGFPTLILHNFNDVIEGIRSGQSHTRYFSYHGHRELLHGLGFMLGMKFHFDGMPEVDGSTPLHPGSTLILELHTRDGSDPDEFFVKLFVWSPKSERQQVELTKCDVECPLEQFTALIRNHLAETGTWEQICGLPDTKKMPQDPHPDEVRKKQQLLLNQEPSLEEQVQDDNDELQQEQVQEPMNLAERRGVSTFGWAFGTVLVMWLATLGILMLIRAHRRYGYQEVV